MSVNYTRLDANDGEFRPAESSETVWTFDKLKDELYLALSSIDGFTLNQLEIEWR